MSSVYINSNVFVSPYSDQIPYHLYTRLLQTFVANYCQVVDNQEPGQGTVILFVYVCVHSV